MTLMAGRSAQTRRGSQEASYLLRTPELSRRSLSQDDTPRPSGVLQGANPGQNVNAVNEQGNASTSQNPSEQQPTKRLGFLGEKLLSASSGSTSSATRGTPIAPTLLPTRSHSRAESALPFISRELSASPTPGMAASSGQMAKGHSSPSKPSATRTYDPKLVSREMHRLGSLAHLPSLTPSLSSASTATLNTAPSISNISSLSSSDNPWATLHVYLLPLFNGEPLRVPIEDLNALVKRHLQTIVSSIPSKALATLEHDASDLIASGMVTLNAKLSGVEEDKLIHRIVEIWGFFWDQVLPYVEGALLPLQTDPMIASLYRMPKAHKPTSPGGQNGKGSISSTMMLQATPQIDVRTIALQLFRDRIIYPAFPVLNARLSARRERPAESPSYQQPRLQQMLLVLVSQRSLPSVLSLTEATPPPTPGEDAIQRLLRTLRTPVVQHSPHMQKHYPAGRAPSFLSAGLPRDRRGRIAQKVERKAFHGVIEDDEIDGDGGETPRIGGFNEPGRDRDREFLESLRSPDPESTNANMGGWGLGAGSEEKKPDDEEEDDTLDWDQAQAVVERMVGMKAEPSTTQDVRRR